MTRVLVIGASGMLGHRMVYGLSSQFDVMGTVRGDTASLAGRPHFASARLVGDVDIENFERVEDVIWAYKPAVVVNAVGAIKQVAEGQSAMTAIRINAYLPHQLAKLCGRIGCRFITFGTDCVFSGKKGPYSEQDIPDPVDVYGRSKLLGEVAQDHCVTLRTSIIGQELRGKHSLVEWFLSQRGRTVKGFRNALYTGVTTATAADVVAQLIKQHSQLSGVWQVAGPQISKFDLLHHIQKAYDVDVEIVPDEAYFCDRRLDGTRFAKETGILIPNWIESIAKMASEAWMYKRVEALSE